MNRAYLSTLLITVLCCTQSIAVSFDWAYISNPDNVDDIHGDGFGGVSYAYRISKHEVTNAQYTEFLNAVAATDTHGLYHPSMGHSTWGGIIQSGDTGAYRYSVKPDAIGEGPGGIDGEDYSYANKPVVIVSFMDAMRFINWLENGQPEGAQGPGTTEDGVYSISNGRSEVRASHATYFIPSEDEWYKAAYYDPHGNGGSGAYYDYPTSSDSTPNRNLPSADTGNSANYLANGNGDSEYSMTDVGSYSLSVSPWGTFDQGGNVWEWNESIIRPSPSLTGRGLRGGSWFSGSLSMHADNRTPFDPTFENTITGFRVASRVPEPNAVLLGALSAGCSLAWMGRRN